MTINVLFVCLGNICRSPTAHGVFQHLVEQHNLQDIISVDSAGTAGWHIGKSPDKRSSAAAAKRGYDLSVLRARQAEESDFDRFHYILAMDENNLADLQALAPSNYDGTLALFLDFHPESIREVPDPYYGGDDGFGEVLSMVEAASKGLLEALCEKHNLNKSNQL